ncbi:TPA: DUF1492 domain-containing protein, partial [Streptococcus suis]|nr:DUF1492 domain-containing protein [Streptococcus suis]
KEDITNRIDRLTTERLELISMIDTLRNPKYRLALNLYYVQHKLDIEVSEIMGISRTTFFRYLRQGQAELVRLLTHAEKEN